MERNVVETTHRAKQIDFQFGFRKGKRKMKKLCKKFWGLKNSPYLCTRF